MKFALTEEQAMFQESVARFMADKSTPAAVRKLMESETGYDPVVWHQLCGDLGLTAIHIPEEYGGIGFGAIELGIVLEEMGRRLYCGPYFSSAVMATYALLHSGTHEQKLSTLPGLAEGTQFGTLVLGESGTLRDAGQSVSATEESGEFSLNGFAQLVPDGHLADLFIVVANSDSGTHLYLTRNQSGIEVTSQTPMDPTRKLSTVTFKDALAERLMGATSGFAQLWDQILTALSYEMIGGTQALFDATVDYTKLRVQFGRAIGSFQAIKHRCADLVTDIELTKSVVYQAGRELDTENPDPSSASMAKAIAADTYMAAAKAAVQLHGGIGFTWENDTHLWFKRAKSSEVFLGTPDWHRERMLTSVTEAA